MSISNVNNRLDLTDAGNILPTDQANSDAQAQQLAAETAARAQLPASLAQPTAAAVQAPDTVARTGESQTGFVSRVQAASLAAPAVDLPPPAKGEVASPKRVYDVLSGISYSNSEAFRIMLQMAHKNHDLDGQLKILGEDGVINNKMANVQATERQIAGEQKASVVQLVTGIAGASASFGMGVAGSRMRMSGQDTEKLSSISAAKGDKQQQDALLGDFVKSFRKNQAQRQQGNAGSSDRSFDLVEKHLQKNLGSSANAFKEKDITDAARAIAGKGGFENKKASYGAGIDMAAQGTGQMVTQLGTTFDKLYGGQAEADKAKIEQKNIDLQQAFYQRIADSSKAKYDQSIQFSKEILDQITSFYSRREQLANKF